MRNWNIEFIIDFNLTLDIISFYDPLLNLMGASINSESQFFHFADSTQNNAESLSTDPMLRLFCRGSC